MCESRAITLFHKWLWFNLLKIIYMTGIIIYNIWTTAGYLISENFKGWQLITREEYKDRYLSH